MPNMKLSRSLTWESYVFFAISTELAWAQVTVGPQCLISPMGALNEVPPNANAGNTTWRLAQSGSPNPVNPNPGAACTPYQCNIFFQWISVYYMPQSVQNTACLTGPAFAEPTRLPGAGLPAGDPAHPEITAPPVADQKPNYITAVFPSITANDGCNQIGNTYSGITTSFLSGDLSTIDSGGATKVFDLADLPCGPPGYQMPPGGKYEPVIAPPSFIFALDPAFSTCIPGRAQGIDPPTPLEAAEGIDGPKIRRRHIDLHASHRNMVREPRQTQAPRKSFRVRRLEDVQGAQFHK